MLFSVVVPVYNVELYLEECVNSILSQSFTDYELILVDDGSTDKSGEICDRFAEKNSKISVIHQRNQGMSCARNSGTAQAKGEYIVYIDSDDYFANEDVFIRLSVKCNGVTDVVMYGYKKYFQNTKTFGNEIKHFPQVNAKDSPKAVIEKLLATDMYDGSAWSKAVKRKMLEINGIAFKPGIISEDSDWYMQVVTCAEKYDCINEVFLIYRQRDGSISHAPKVKSLTDNMNMLESWPKRIDERVKNEVFRKTLLSVLARYYGNILILYSGFSSEIRKAYRQQMVALSYLLKYSITKRAVILKGFVDILGIDGTVFLLRILLRIKK